MGPTVWNNIRLLLQEACKHTSKCHLLKSSAAFFLLELFDLCKYRGQQCGTISDCSYRGSLIWVHTVCLKAKIFQQTTKKTTSVVIGTLKVNIIGFVGNY